MLYPWGTSGGESATTVAGDEAGEHGKATVFGYGQLEDRIVKDRWLPDQSYVVTGKGDEKHRSRGWFDEEAVEEMPYNLRPAPGHCVTEDGKLWMHVVCHIY